MVAQKISSVGESQKPTARIRRNRLQILLRNVLHKFIAVDQLFEALVQLRLLALSGKLFRKLFFNEDIPFRPRNLLRLYRRRTRDLLHGALRFCEPFLNRAHVFVRRLGKILFLEFPQPRPRRRIFLAVSFHSPPRALRVAVLLRKSFRLRSALEIPL